MGWLAAFWPLRGAAGERTLKGLRTENPRLIGTGRGFDSRRLHHSFDIGSNGLRAAFRPDPSYIQPPSFRGRQAGEPAGLSVPELVVPYEPSADSFNGTMM